MILSQYIWSGRFGATALAGRFYSGKLGSSTIVGSAAFNLFAITAVCILAIPAGEVRDTATKPRAFLRHRALAEG